MRRSVTNHTREHILNIEIKRAEDFKLKKGLSGDGLKRARGSGGDGTQNNGDAAAGLT